METEIEVFSRVARVGLLETTFHFEKVRYEGRIEEALY